jgi:hypothetical protein
MVFFLKQKKMFEKISAAKFELEWCICKLSVEIQLNE